MALACGQMCTPTLPPPVITMVNQMRMLEIWHSHRPSELPEDLHLQCVVTHQHWWLQRQCSIVSHQCYLELPCKCWQMLLLVNISRVNTWCIYPHGYSSRKTWFFVVLLFSFIMASELCRRGICPIQFSKLRFPVMWENTLKCLCHIFMHCNRAH